MIFINTNCQMNVTSATSGSSRFLSLVNVDTDELAAIFFCFLIFSTPVESNILPHALVRVMHHNFIKSSATISFWLLSLKVFVHTPPILLSHCCQLILLLLCLLPKEPNAVGIMHHCNGKYCT